MKKRLIPLIERSGSFVFAERTVQARSECEPTPKLCLESDGGR